MKIFVLLFCLSIAALGKVIVIVSPSSVTLTSGATQQFTANQSVTWSASAGTINSSGLFTAPTVAAQTTVIVTAKTTKPPRAFGTATVTVNPVVQIQHTVDLSWIPSVTLDVASYDIYRKAPGGTYALEASAVLGTPCLQGRLCWTDTTVVSGQSYVYTATSFDPDGDGESIISNEVLLVIP